MQSQVLVLYTEFPNNIVAQLVRDLGSVGVWYECVY